MTEPVVWKLVLFALAGMSAAAAWFGLETARRLFPSPLSQQLSRALGWLMLVGAGNFAGLLCELLPQPLETRVLFVLMMAVLFVSTGLAWSLLSVGGELLGKPLAPLVQRSLVTLGLVLLLSAVLASAFDPLSGGTQVKVSWGYLGSTMLVGLTVAVTVVRIALSRDLVAPGFRRLVVGLAATGLALGAASALNDAFQVFVQDDGEGFAFSTVALVLSGPLVGWQLFKRLHAVVSEPAPSVPPELSDREGEVFSLWIDGLSREELAERLFVSPHTIKNHINAIYRKLGASSRWELLQRYQSRGRSSDLGPGA